jgi:hypothetical protein
MKTNHTLPSLLAPSLVSAVQADHSPAAFDMATTVAMKGTVSRGLEANA